MSDGFLRSFRGGRLLLAGFLGLLLLLFIGRWGVVLYADLLWFSAEGMPEIFWTRVFWEWGARVLAGVLTAIVTSVNLKVVARSFQGLQVRRRFGDLVIQEQLPASYVDWGVLGASIFIGFWLATVIPPGTGLRMMLVLNAEPWGMVDPILGRDLGFYLFHLPVIRGAVGFGLAIVALLAFLSAAGYAATGALGWANGRPTLALRPARHFAVLAGVFMVLLGLRFYLVPFGLLANGSSGVQEIFGYADHHARIPGFRMLAFLCLATAAAVFWGGRAGRLLPAGVGAIALAFAAVGLGEVYPALIQRFRVQPNELEREAPYIRDAIALTRVGFALDGMTRNRLEYAPPDAVAWSGALERLRRLPVWTDATLLTTFRELEARFQYYDFQEVALDRYETAEGPEPVAVSVREVSPTGIQDPNWQNLHLREVYISGMGAVAGHLSRQTDEGRLPMFLTAIPPEFRPGPAVPDQLELTRPSVFIGSRPQLYSIINATEDSFLGPEGAPGTAGVDYPNGIRMGSILRTLALAWRFQDPNLLLASEIGPESRLLFRRQVQERVTALAPFLLFPEAPYPVITEGRIAWILEGFTVASSLPVSLVHELAGGRDVNYMRNSIKAVVDAVTGETRMYVADPEDPIIQTYRRGFPTLFHDLSEMPSELRDHLRYSRHLLETQAEVLTRFHQESPPVFHGQQDRWELATELSNNPAVPVPYRPEYGLLTLPGHDEETYVLSTVFVPQGRQNLASFIAGRWVPGRGGELLLWDAPVEQQILGPGQIEAMVEQDPEISQQFSLWRQGGSQVWTGHLHLVPVENTLYYLESVFLAADVDAIPEIRRFVVSDGRSVVMESSIERALGYLAQGSLLGEAGIDLREGEPPPIPERRDINREALEALERAETSLREGNWEAFGLALEEAKRILLQDVVEGPSAP